MISGDKTGDDRFYERMIPIADQLYDVYIAVTARFDKTTVIISNIGEAP